MKQKHLKNLILTAMFLAVGMVLPFLTGQIKAIGNMLLPMHLPILLCGLICGWKYGGAAGLILPLLRSVTFGMPVFYPNALGMAVELCAYGLLVGLFYGWFQKKNLLSLYGSLIPAMLGGRILWGIAQTVLLGLSGKTFTFAVFWANGFAKALPGIILQLILIPAIMTAVQMTGKKKKQ